MMTCWNAKQPLNANMMVCKAAPESRMWHKFRPEHLTVAGKLPTAYSLSAGPRCKQICNYMCSCLLFVSFVVNEAWVDKDSSSQAPTDSLEKKTPGGLCLKFHNLQWHFSPVLQHTQHTMMLWNASGLTQAGIVPTEDSDSRGSRSAVSYSISNSKQTPRFLNTENQTHCQQFSIAVWMQFNRFKCYCMMVKSQLQRFSLDPHFVL